MYDLRARVVVDSTEINKLRPLNGGRAKRKNVKYTHIHTHYIDVRFNVFELKLYHNICSLKSFAVHNILLVSCTHSRTSIKGGAILMRGRLDSVIIIYKTNLVVFIFL